MIRGQAVDFVVNCYQRTYRDVLAPGFMAATIKQQQVDFARRTVLVNNVADRVEARDMAEALVRSGELDRYAFVSDHLDAALAATALRPRHLKRLPHFTDCCLVAVTIDGPEWIVYWDSDAVLAEPGDWVSPVLDAMLDRPELAIGNPNNWHEGLAEREALVVEGDLAIGYGFSDVAFLARRSDLASPIYRKIAPASWRYPLAHVEPIFEQRVDAWMRRSRRLRATFLPITVTHPTAAGANYPRPGLRGRTRGHAQRAVERLASRVDTPAMKAWPTVHSGGPRRGRVWGRSAN